MIKTTGLSYQYPGATPIAFADIDVPQGAIALVSGPSGCGKSTLLALIAALVPAGGGQLVVADQALQGLSSVAADAWRARTIGFLPQRLHLSAALTVQENLLMAQWAAGQPEDLASIAKALQSLDVAALAGRKPSQLSGGQAQRVALARAVLLNPRVILADEPTASLDDDNATAAVSLLTATAARSGATLVIATHDARVASLIADHADGGRGYVALMLKRSYEVPA
jgi:putative ABC transport system ATP-binding protein